MSRLTAIRFLLALLAVALVLATSARGDPAAPGPNECADSIDNDGDGLIDQADPGCLGRRDQEEARGRQLADDKPTLAPTATPTPTQTPAPAPRSACSDGVDNDRDGKTDVGQDPGCASATDTDEADPVPAAGSPPPAGGGAAAPSAPAPATPAPSDSRPRTRMLAPFPVVRMSGRVFRTRLRINLLTVQAPAGAMISVNCHGGGCGRATQELRARSSRSNRRLHRFERTLRAGAVLEIRVSKSDTIGKFTRFAVRRARLPARSDRCLRLDGRTPRSCPGD